MTNHLAKRVASSIAQLKGNSAYAAKMSSAARQPIRRPPTELPVFAWMSGQPATERESTPFDWALLLAVSTYATHQQGRSSEANVYGKSFATAMKELADIRDMAPIERRVFAVLQCSTPMRLGRHLRGPISMLRDAGIGFDYVRFAYDIEVLLDPGADSSTISRAWGRDLHRPALRSAGSGVPVLRQT